MRLIHSEPLTRVIAREKAAEQAAYSAAHACVLHRKQAGDAETTHALSGELYASKSGWILLSVPNALVRGAFDALNEPGVELPTKHSGTLNAHISVMRPEELESIGGVDKITERGHHFHYTLGPVQEVEPAGWDEMSKVWFIQVKSTELQDLRKSYGLSPRPNDNKFNFHITIGVRKKNVLRHNDVAKAAGLLPLIGAGVNAAEFISPTPEQPPEPDPSMSVMADESHLEELRRKKKPITQGINPVITEGPDNGMLAMQQAKAANSEDEAGHEDDAASTSEEEDFDCKEEDLAAIYAYYDGNTKAADAVEPEHKKKTWRDHLISAGLPIGAAGAASAALAAPTNTLVPAQTTQFPGGDRPHLIRGGIYPGALASVLEDTGGGYMMVGPETSQNYNTGAQVPQPRTHAYVHNPDDFRTAIQSQQRPGAPLQQLEIAGHGSVSGQDLGASHMDPAHQLNRRNVDHVAETLRSIPRTPDSTVVGYGCNTGLCLPHPRNNWWQRLSDQSGVTAMGARGYVNTEDSGALWVDTHSTGRTGPNTPGTRWQRITPTIVNGQPVNDYGEDYSFTRYRPHQPQEVVRTQDRDSTSKKTWGNLPATRLHELLYNIGRPSAVLGALSPLLSDKTTARNTALGATALTAPMVISEIMARHGQAQGDIATGHAPNTLGTHLNAQSKVLPYLGMAALPLLSYGGANMLGRWKHKEEEKKK